MEKAIAKADDFLSATLKSVGTNKWNETKMSRNNVEVLIQLNSYCYTLTQTIFQMLLDGSVWECEILARSVSEGSIKLLYICGKKEEMSAKLQQFQEELIDYAYNKDSERAAFYNEGVKDAPDIQKHIYSSMGTYKVPFQNQEMREKE